MAVTVEVMSCDAAVKAKRKTAAERVLRKFDGKLPDLKLLAFFDDIDDPHVRRDWGPANRGVSGPITAKSPTLRWLLDPLGMPRRVRDDYGTYLHGSTCADEIALTMTFAHELQHFVQYGFKRQLRAGGGLILSLPKDVRERERLGWLDIPHEREARIEAKKVGVELFGEDAVKGYIDRLIKEAQQRRTNQTISQSETNAEIEDLRFSQKFDDLSVSYDLATEMTAIFRRLKPYEKELENVLRQKRGCPDYQDADLSSYFGGS
jgi:hypothetical protein